MKHYRYKVSVQNGSETRKRYFTINLNLIVEWIRQVPHSNGILKSDVLNELRNNNQNISRHNEKLVKWGYPKH